MHIIGKTPDLKQLNNDIQRKRSKKLCHEITTSTQHPSRERAQYILHLREARCKSNLEIDPNATVRTCIQPGRRDDASSSCAVLRWLA